MILSLNEIIHNFFATNPFLRRFRLLCNNVIIPITLKFFIATIIFSIGLIFILKIFNPKLVNKLYYEVSGHFYQIFDLDGRNFRNINIDGNNKVSDQEIIDVVNKAIIQSPEVGISQYQPVIYNIINDISKTLPWVKDVRVNRNLPDILNISIIEFEPFAMWHSNDQKFLIDKNGNTIAYQENVDHDKMIILSGQDANIHAKSLFNILTTDLTLSNQVYSATWVGKRRWDLRLNSGLIIKLPENNISTAWKKMTEFFAISGSIIDLEVVDLRVDGKMFLRYKKNVMKEVKKL